MDDALTARAKAKPPSSPNIPPDPSAAPWLSQLTAALAIAAAAIGRVLAPGLRGSASQNVVDTWESIGNFTAFAFVVFLIFLLGRAGWDLAFRARPAVPLRVSVISGAVAVACLVVTTIVRAQRTSQATPTAALIAVALIACGVSLIAAAATIRPPHTRMVAFVLCTFGFASLIRLGAWKLAVIAGEHASPMNYEFARILASLGLFFEFIGQGLAIIWLTTRTRVSGQILAGISVILAMVVTWGVAEGGHGGAATWQAILHTSLADVRGTPPPLGFLLPVPIFLVATSILFAAIAVIRPGPAPAITSALALFLIGRGAFDIPLRALSTCVGATWLLVASVDERTMWRALSARRDPANTPKGETLTEPRDSKPDAPAEVAAD